MLTENQIKAKALVIGQQLARADWWEMNAELAEIWYKQRALELGATLTSEQDRIAQLAMSYVLKSDSKSAYSS